MTLDQAKIALVHDYLIQDGGAERVLGALQEMFPKAPTYTLLYDSKHPQVQGKDIRASFLKHWPLSRKFYEWYMPLMPMATEHFSFEGYDLVISSSSLFAKGIIVPPETKHVCYCHTPTRFLWQERLGYVNDLPQPLLLRRLLPFILHRLRTWDRLAADRPDLLLTNSQTSFNRIQRYYRRTPEIIAPPVDIAKIPVSTRPGSYWLAGGRLVGYKRFDLIVHAFTKLDIPLKIFGTGPEYRKLRKAAGKRIEFLGYVTDQQKLDLYQDAIGYVYPQIEDFGITAVEAMAAGKPVIAYGKGGGAETVLHGVTGQHLEAQCWEDIGDAVIRFSPEKYNPQQIRAHAETYSKEHFQAQMRNTLETFLSA